MEEYFILLVRFVTCLSAVIGAVIIMVKADDNAAARRLACALGVLVVLLNERIGYYAYLLFGSLLETLLMSAGLVSVVILVISILLTIATLPILAAVRWLVR